MSALPYLAKDQAAPTEIQSPQPAPRGSAASPGTTEHRSLFLSDMHLGARMCRPDLILAFLDTHWAETIYLVGDIVDNWQPLASNWTESHHKVLRRLLALPQTGARVVYLPGNHDAFFQKYAGSAFSGIEVEREVMHLTADGRRLLVTHGDQCDIFARRAPVMARVGAWFEGGARAMDAAQIKAARAIGARPWDGISRSIAGVNAFLRSRDHFEERLCALARERGADGIICGHFHQPALHIRHGALYANCGDWAENASGLVESHSGKLSLMGVTQSMRHGMPGTAAIPEEALAWTL